MRRRGDQITSFKCTPSPPGSLTAARLRGSVPPSAGRGRRDTESNADRVKFQPRILRCPHTHPTTREANVCPGQGQSSASHTPQLRPRKRPACGGRTPEKSPLGRVTCRRQGTLSASDLKQHYHPEPRSRERPLPPAPHAAHSPQNRTRMDGINPATSPRFRTRIRTLLWASDVSFRSPLPRRRTRGGSSRNTLPRAGLPHRCAWRFEPRPDAHAMSPVGDAGTPSSRKSPGRRPPGRHCTSPHRTPQSSGREAGSQARRSAGTRPAQPRQQPCRTTPIDDCAQGVQARASVPLPAP